jgi:hypothetical protein
MGLQTDVQGEGNVLDGSVEMEEKARVFNKFCGMADRRGALEYFGKLRPEEQDYIRKSKKY